jgi:uncharacterized RDD family membrane protein YckC
MATRLLVFNRSVQLALTPRSASALADGVLLYFVVFEGVLGATPGKLLTKLRILRTDGQRCGFVGAILRTVGRPLDWSTGGILPVLLVRFSPSRRHLGDRLAGAVVVTDSRTDVCRIKPTWIVAATITVAAFLYACPLLMSSGISQPWLSP